MSNYLDAANSRILFFICLIPVVLTWIQAFLFLKKGVRQAKEIGIEDSKIKKIISSTAVFSIMPSLPVLITMMALIPVLGRFIPWLRLSVIGNAMYESMAADMAIKAYGLTGLGDTSLTLPVFGTVVWAMTLGIMVCPVLTVFALKGYDKKIKAVQHQQEGFRSLAIGALLVGMLSLMTIPRLVYFQDLTGILVMLVSTAAAIALDILAKKLNKKGISDFAFPIAMCIGMASAILWTALLGGAS